MGHVGAKHSPLRDNVTLEALILEPNQGDLLTFPGVSTRIKIRGEMTGGALTLIESTVEPHFAGFKVHVHQSVTETFYILEGSIQFRLDERTVNAQAGAMVLVSPGTWHTYSNPSDQPAKYLLFITPGGFEKFLEGLAQANGKGEWSDADRAMLNALAEKYDAAIA